MQFTPKGGVPNPNEVTDIYARASDSRFSTPMQGNAEIIAIGSAWRDQENMTLRINVYQSSIWQLETYTTSDGQDFLPLLISRDDFRNTDIRLTGMSAGYDRDNDSKYGINPTWEAVGYIRQSDDKKNFKLSLSLSAVKSQMAPTQYGGGMFAVVNMRTIDEIEGGVRSVGVISMMFPGQLSDRVMTSCLINRISVSLGSRDDEA